MGNILLGNWLKFLESTLAKSPRIWKVLKDFDPTISLINSAKEYNSKSWSKAEKRLMYKNMHCKRVYVKKFKYPI